MLKGKLHSIVTNLRSQILTYCTGQGDFYFDLRDEQVRSEWVGLNDVKQFPLVCIAAATENLTQMTIGMGVVGSGEDRYFKPEFEVELFGYVKSDSSDVAMPECLKLLSDIENAILSDDSLGSGVVGLVIKSMTGNFERKGVLHMILSGSYSGR